MRDQGESQQTAEAAGNAVDAVQPAPRRTRRARTPRKANGPIGIRREQLVDVGQAIIELEAAREEIASVPDGLSRHKRQQALLEPMSRLDLVVRFCQGILNRNGWSREP